MAQDPRDPEASHGGIWAEYRFHVLSQLERLGKDIEKNRDDILKEFDKDHKTIQTIEEQVFQLRLKAAFWGGIGAAVGYVISFLVSKALGGK